MWKQVKCKETDKNNRNKETTANVERIGEQWNGRLENLRVNCGEYGIKEIKRLVIGII